MKKNRSYLKSGLILLLMLSFFTNIQLKAQENEEEGGRPAKRKKEEPKAIIEKDNAPVTSISFIKGIPNLSQKQKDKIAKSRKKLEEDLGVFNKKKIEKSAQLKALKADENSDAFEIDKLTLEVDAINANMEVLRKKHIQDVRPLLNDEQKVYFDNKLKASLQKDSVFRQMPAPTQKPAKKKKKSRGQSDACPPSQ